MEPSEPSAPRRARHDRAGPAHDPDSEAAVGEDRAGLVERLAREQRSRAQTSAGRTGLPVAVDSDDREDAHVGGVELPEVDLGLAGSQCLSRDPVDVEEGRERLAEASREGVQRRVSEPSASSLATKSVGVGTSGRAGSKVPPPVDGAGAGTPTMKVMEKALDLPAAS